MIIGAVITPIAEIMKSIPARVPLVLAMRPFRSWSPRSLYSAKTGMKACEKAPSANNLRKKFGILKATKNTSVPKPAPNKRAITISRMKPRLRDKNVMLLTIAVDLNSFSLIRKESNLVFSLIILILPETVSSDRHGQSLNSNCFLFTYLVIVGFLLTSSFN